MKTVLIITYYWPPAGGPGVQRVLRFVKHLPQYGWQPLVLTVKNGDYPARDESLAAEIPAQCRVFRCGIVEPYDLYRRLTGKKRGEALPTFVMNPQAGEGTGQRLARWLRANLFIPDARVGWIPMAVRAGRKILCSEKIDLIFATSPPHTVQLIARRLSRRCGVPFVADFRDPWSQAFWAADAPRNPFSAAIDRRMERAVLKDAAAVVTVSRGIAELLSASLPSARRENRFEVIHNGFEPLAPRRIPCPRFILLFIGHLSSYQNPESIFQAVEQLPEALRQTLDIIFVGRVFEGFAELFQRYSHLNLEVHGHMNHDALMHFAGTASVLLRPVARSAYAESAVGAKTWDYLSLRKPILTLGEKDSFSQTLLKETGSGELFEYQDVAGIAEFIERQWRRWKKEGNLLLDNETQLQGYTSAAQVERLAALFREIAG